MTINTLLLDLDGTMVDTAPDFAWVLNHIRAELALPPLAESLIRSAVSDGARGMVEQGLPERKTDEHLHLPSDDDVRQRFLQEYTQLLLAKQTQAKPYQGIRELVTLLGETGWKWGVVTNKPSAMAIPLLETLELLPEVLICPDHVSKAKPSPEGLYLACEQLSITPNQAIYVGDHLRDIEAGKAAGMLTVAAEWGYLTKEENPSDWQATAICRKSHQLWEQIQTLCLEPVKMPYQ